MISDFYKATDAEILDTVDTISAALETARRNMLDLFLVCNLSSDDFKPLHKLNTLMEQIHDEHKPKYKPISIKDMNIDT